MAASLGFSSVGSWDGSQSRVAVAEAGGQFAEKGELQLLEAVSEDWWRPWLRTLIYTQQ
jgi:hypothetical protein